MKKKGLIIATIVMVLVLAVSLTTATYAWFTASSSTKVDQISLSINAANVVSIGALADTGATGQDKYLYDTVTLGHGTAGAATANTPTYTGDTKGLGSTLAFSTTTTLNLSTAVATAATVVRATKVNETITPGSVTSQDATFDPSHTVFKANAGATDSTINNETIDFANANEDYVVLKMGAQAAKSGVKGIYATVKVTTSDTSTSLKMMAAMHFYIKVGATHAEFDLFGSSNHQNTLKTEVVTTGAATGVILAPAASQGQQATATFSFLIAGSNSSSGADLAYDGTTITDFEIYAYVFGPDGDCVSTATGCSATIDIEFFGVTSDAATVFADDFIALA